MSDRVDALAEAMFVVNSQAQPGNVQTVTESHSAWDQTGDQSQRRWKELARAALVALHLNPENPPERVVDWKDVRALGDALKEIKDDICLFEDGGPWMVSQQASEMLDAALAKFKELEAQQ